MVISNINTHKEQWISGLIKNGLKPLIEILDVVDSDNWVFWERYWISQFRAWGFELTNIGIGGEGGNCTQEIRKKISESKKGSKSRLGSKWTEEQRMKIIGKLKGRKQEKSTIDKRVEKNTKSVDIDFIKNKYLEGLNYKQIGDLVGLSASKIYKTLRNNKLILNKKLAI